MENEKEKKLECGVFSNDELLLLINLCDDKRYMHLGIVSDVLSSEAWQDDRDHLNRVIAYQEKCLASYDDVLSKLHCLACQQGAFDCFEKNV